MDIRLSFSIGSRASSETHSYKDDDAGHPAWSGDIYVLGEAQSHGLHGA
jgi:hypothetical protein